jgi:hypothetical protein
MAESKKDNTGNWVLGGMVALIILGIIPTNAAVAANHGNQYGCDYSVTGDGC